MFRKTQDNLTDSSWWLFALFKQTSSCDVILSQLAHFYLARIITMLMKAYILYIYAQMYCK